MGCFTYIHIFIYLCIHINIHIFILPRANGRKSRTKSALAKKKKHNKKIIQKLRYHASNLRFIGKKNSKITLVIRVLTLAPESLRNHW